MSRPVCASLIAVLAAGAIALEAQSGVRAFFLGWLGANALPESPEAVSVIDVSGDRMAAVDAALVMRAILRYEPRAVAFLLPIEIDGKESLLAAKLAEAKAPVTFTANDRPVILPDVHAAASVPLPPRVAAYVPAGHRAGTSLSTAGDKVQLVARQGPHAVASGVLCFAMGSGSVSGEVPGRIRVGAESILLDAEGSAVVNPVARDYVERLAFDQLMLQTERSEGGSISTVLDAKFRGRLVAVQQAGAMAAAGAAAIVNDLTVSPAPLAVSIAFVLLAATLPWWVADRRTRVILAVMACCGWALLAMSLYQEFRVALPVLPALFLPVMALLPCGSDKSKGRKLPA